MNHTQTKLAFFDMDGVLSAPVFQNKEGQRVIGFSDESWRQHCVEHDENTYAHCRPLPIVYEYAKKLKEEGATLYVLTVSENSFENNAKKKFTQTHYPNLFMDVISVSSEQAKPEVMHMMAQKYQISPQACELVEDTYSTLLKVIALGMKGPHLSHLLMS